MYCYYTTNASSIDSIFLTSVATSLRQLHMEYSYQNSYVITDLAVTTQTFYRARLLTIRLHEEGYIVAILKSSQRKYYGRHYHFMRNSADASRKAKDADPTDAPGPCSQVLVEFRLVIHFCFFVLKE